MRARQRWLRTAMVTTIVTAGVGVAAYRTPMSAAGRRDDRPPVATDAAAARAAEAYGRLPLRFEQNAGQFDPRVRFASSGPGYTLFLTNHDAVLTLGRPKTKDHSEAVQAVLRMGLAGANETPRVAGLDRLPTVSNYYMGERTNWHSGVPNFGRVRYDAVYPGVDLVYYGSRQQLLEYDFEVAPGADPSRIALEIEGADTLSLDGAGDLVVATAAEAVRLHRPVIYQEIDGVRHPVDGAFTLDASSRRIAFAIGEYDKAKPLVIDPILEYLTFVGGSAIAWTTGVANAVAVDAAGSAYITGYAGFADFPVTAGALNVRNASSGGHYEDVFVTRLDPTGSSLIYSAYFGGGSSDFANGIAIDPQGNAYVVGTTYARPDAPAPGQQPDPTGVFPSTTFAYSGFGYLYGCSAQAAFVTKLDPTGGLIYSEMLGGTGACSGGNGIAVDAAGNAYMAGWTQPAAGVYEVFAGIAAGPDDHGTAVVAKLDPNGAVVWARFLGGSALDFANSIAVDSGGNTYVTGGTGSSDFPTTADAFQPINHGSSEAFLTKLGQGGNILYSTYIGGSSSENSADGLTSGHVTLDASGNVYLSGKTTSLDFPVTANTMPPAQTTDRAFVMKFDAALSLQYSLVIGSIDIKGLAADNAGNVTIVGAECYGVPAVNRIVGRKGYGDGLVAKINPTASAFIYTTCLGGGGPDATNAIALDPAGNAYVAGYGNSGYSEDVPTTPGVFQSVNALPPAILNGSMPVPTIAKIVEPPSTGGAKCVPKPDGLVSWWRGEGDPTDSIGPNSGTLLGGVTFEPGRVGNAFRFHGRGGDGLQLPPLSPGAAYSISMWINPMTNVGALLSNQYASGRFGISYFLQQTASTGLIEYVNTQTGWGTISGGTDATSVPLNGWSLITVTSDGTRLRWFVNGNQQMTLAAFPQVLDGIPLLVGAEVPSVVSTFSGLIDEIALFDRALSAREIFSIYDAGAAGMCSRPPDTTPPSFSGGSGDITIEATSSAGAVVNYTPPTANDDVDGAVAVACNPPSGSAFAIGSAAVTCTASDSSGNSASTTFSVTVVDTTVPLISGTPSDFAVEATSGAGAVVGYTAPTASDAVDGAVAVSCSPASGATLSLGAHVVTCTAVDAHGNVASSSFNVTVRDTTAPTVTVPANIAASAASASGATVSYSASASDAVDGAVAATCSPASGSTFALGTTTVTCTATDKAGNVGSSSFAVTVNDTTPPALTLPANINVQATSGNGAAVSYAASATDAVDGAVAVNCAPASGSIFAVGATTVSCTATDRAGNTALGGFTVTVATPPPSTNHAPVCGAAAPSVSVLAPPNHQWVPIAINGVTDADGDRVGITVTGIFQDEPVNGLGDGDTAPDGAGVGTATAQVRAERAGNGNGRVYHITFSATDGRGGSCGGEVIVRVPRDQSPKGAAIDDGAIYNSVTGGRR